MYKENNKNILNTKNISINDITFLDKENVNSISEFGNSLIKTLSLIINNTKEDSIFSNLGGEEYYSIDKFFNFSGNKISYLFTSELIKNGKFCFSLLINDRIVKTFFKKDRIKKSYINFSYNKYSKKITLFYYYIKDNKTNISIYSQYLNKSINFIEKLSLNIFINKLIQNVLNSKIIENKSVENYFKGYILKSNVGLNDKKIINNNAISRIKNRIKLFKKENLNKKNIFYFIKLLNLNLKLLKFNLKIF